MAKKRDGSVAIVGAGLIGMSSAWRLTQSGCPVTVYDQGAYGAEASWAGAGMLSPGEIEGPSPLAALSIESRQLYAQFVRELTQASGSEIDYQECGALDLAYSPDEQSALEGKAARQKALGVSSRLVTVKEVAQFWPRVRMEGLIGARFYPGDGIVNPRELLAALRIACEKLGASFNLKCPVTGIDLSGDSILVHTPRGLDRFDGVVIAAGAWSSSIEVTGVPPLPRAEPVKGQLVGYQQPDGTCGTILRHGSTYMLQRANGMLIAGASVEHVGFDRELRADILEDLVRRAAFLLPHLAETTPSEEWMGFRPASEELQLGSWYSPHFYLAYGHYRNGILLAPVTAQRLASEISANFGMH